MKFYVHRSKHSVFRLIENCSKLKFSKFPRYKLWMGGSVLEKKLLNWLNSHLVKT